MTVGSDPGLKLPEVFLAFAHGDSGSQAAVGNLGFEKMKSCGESSCSNSERMESGLREVFGWEYQGGLFFC